MSHKYKHPDTGKRVVASVTTIISDCTDKSGPLTQWAANMTVGWLKENCAAPWPDYPTENGETYLVTDADFEDARFNFRNVSKDARDVGSEVHAAIEEYLRQTFTDTDTDTDTDTEYNIICYNIDNNCKYPFLKFMVTYDNDNNRFVFPKSSTIDESIQKLKSILKSIGCDYKKLDMTMYRGIYLNKYICFNISEIDVNLLKYGDTLFALPTEIINNGEINGLKIDEELTKLFKDEIELSILRNKNKETFILPDVVYTFEDNLKESEFNLIFGNKKSKKYNCRDY